MLIAGLALALLGVPTMLLVASRTQANTLAPAFRVTLWILAAVVVACAIIGTPSWRAELGVQSFTVSTVASALLATAGVIVAWPVLRLVRSASGGGLVEESPQFRAIVALSFRYRIFLVATAATVEETLYRGYAIGIGSHALGNVFAAAILSLVMFTLAHVRWGVSHLISVAWSAGVLTLLFVMTGDLFACILSHALIDAVGLLIVPALTKNAGTGTRDEGGAAD